MSATIFNNKSSFKVNNADMVIMGKSGNYKVTISSYIPNTETKESSITIKYSLSGINDRLQEYNLENNMVKKISSKFKKFDHACYNPDEGGYIELIYENDEFISSPKRLIKIFMKLNKITKNVDDIVAFIDKLVDNKIERRKATAAKKAERLAAEKAAAEAIPSATVATKI